MSGKLIVAIIMQSAQILGRALGEAYKQAAINAAKNPSMIEGAASPATRTTGMSLDEAFLILNLPKRFKQEELDKNYDYLFKANDPAAGGSLYLQSKVYRARERILSETLDQLQTKQETAKPKSK